MAKVITQIKSGITGEVFGFKSGTASYREEVSVRLISGATISPVDFSQYAIKVTLTRTGEVAYYTPTSDGLCSFTVDFDEEYTVQLPVVGSYIAPPLMTYTAKQTSRLITFKYIIAGVFGIDANGVYYTLAECEALADKSIIIAGGYTDEALNNSIRDDGTTGNGFMWDINQEALKASWASANVEFSQDLLPFVTSDALAMPYCNGEAYTRYMVAEAARLSVTSPAATLCQGRTLTTNSIAKNGYIPAYGQIRKLILNITSFNALYTALGLTAPTIKSGNWWTSCQYSAPNAVGLGNGNFINYFNKTGSNSVLVVFDL
jgi:hypothetical protein